MALALARARRPAVEGRLSSEGLDGALRARPQDTTGLSHPFSCDGHRPCRSSAGKLGKPRISRPKRGDRCGAGGTPPAPPTTWYPAGRPGAAHRAAAAPATSELTFRTGVPSVAGSPAQPSDLALPFHHSASKSRRPSGTGDRPLTSVRSWHGLPGPRRPSHHSSITLSSIRRVASAARLRRLTFELRRPPRQDALAPRRTMEPATALRGAKVACLGGSPLERGVRPHSMPEPGVHMWLT
jgi:hypothetical protein